MSATDTTCDPCFYDWHESCRTHELLGSCCCGAEDTDDDGEDEW